MEMHRMFWMNDVLITKHYSEVDVGKVEVGLKFHMLLISLLLLVWWKYIITILTDIMILIFHLIRSVLVRYFTLGQCFYSWYLTRCQCCSCIDEIKRWWIIWGMLIHKKVDVLVRLWWFSEYVLCKVGTYCTVDTLIIVNPITKMIME